jgi:hypothetical protein
MNDQTPTPNPDAAPNPQAAPAPTHLAIRVDQFEQLRVMAGAIPGEHSWRLNAFVLQELQLIGLTLNAPADQAAEAVSEALPAAVAATNRAGRRAAARRKR